MCAILYPTNIEERSSTVDVYATVITLLKRHSFTGLNIRFSYQIDYIYTILSFKFNEHFETCRFLVSKGYLRDEA